MSADIERFRQAIGRRLGLHFDDAKHGFLTEILEERIGAAGSRARAYLSELESQEGATEELRALAERLTVGETYFFRNIEQLEAFGDVALPSRMQARRDDRTLRVLSAGCASGEEPYSLAMLVRARLAGAGGWRMEVTGVDVDRSALARARRARYSPWSLRETPEDARKRWFRAEGREFVLDDAIRSSVVLEERNLAVEDPRLWAPESYDVIFFRNVVMYFTTEQAHAVIGRIEQALAPGGFLFLGHAETLRGLSNGFSLCHSHGTFYYQRKGGRSIAPGTERSHPIKPNEWVEGSLGELLEDSTCWVDSICRASARIQGLAESAMGSGGSSAGDASGDVARRTSRDVARSRELLREERFHEALELIGSLPSDSGQTPDVLLLQAALLAHSGDLVDAERACLQLLAGDDLNAGAHYLLALCREGAGDPAKAIEHDESAVYLDPGFAMPRLHLGLIARRRGDHEVARREFGQAIALFQREDSARLLLFGGGFQRDALIALCRAELARCGDHP